jgi:O-antigen ligase
MGALAFGSALFGWFYRLAQQERYATIVGLILGLIVTETGLYETIDVPTGLFHPASGSLKFETVDFIILVALVASLWAGHGRYVLSKTSLLWGAFCAWVASEAVVGLLNGNPTSDIAYEAKIILYLGLFVLARRVPLRDPHTRRVFAVLLYYSAVVAGLSVTLGAAGSKLSLSAPGLRGASLGNVGSIGANLFVALGILGLCIAICSDRHRFPLLFVIGPLFVPPLMAQQRAALVNLGVSLAVLAVLLPAARHRLRATSAELLLVVLAAVALVALPVFVNGTVHSRRVIPFSHSLTKALTGGEKKLSAQDRVNQYDAARTLIAQRPITGWGLGKTITYYEVGFRQFITTYLTHNIAVDLLLRTGVVGLLLFVLALGGSLAQGVDAWRNASDPVIAATALASVAILTGWLAHGMVESLFEHVQLAPLFAIMIGLAQAAASQRREQVESVEHGLMPLAAASA